VRELNRVRWILIVLSLAVAVVGGVALTRGMFFTEAGSGREWEERTRRIQHRNEAFLERIEELERVYRDEVLPNQKGLSQSREQLEGIFGTFYPEIEAVASSRDLARWPPALDDEGGLAWAQAQELFSEVLQDPRIFSQVGFAGKD